MPLCARHHHVIGIGVAKGLPLHHLLAEGGKGAFARLTTPEIARSQMAQRILFGKIMDRPGGGIGAHRLRAGRIGQIAPGKGRGEATQLARRIDPAKRKGGAARQSAAMLADHGSSHAKTSIGAKIAALAKVAEIR